MRKVEAGVLVTLVLAFIAGIFWLGKLDQRIENLENGDEVERQKEAAIADIKTVVEHYLGRPEVPIGTILAFAGRVTSDSREKLVREGWLPCNGGIIYRSDFPELYTLLAGTYGQSSDGGYWLPDLQGRVPMGSGQGVGLRRRDLGQKLGLEAQVLTVENLPPHSHEYQMPKRKGSREFDTFAEGDREEARSGPARTSDTGSAKEFSVVQPSLTVNFIIKAR